MFANSNSANRFLRKTQFFIFGLAFLLRAGYVLAQYRYGIVNGGFIGGDTPRYLTYATNILAGKGMANQIGLTAYDMPGYGIFLAACFALFGTNPIWASLIQSILSAVACVFIARYTAILFGNKAGLIAGLTAAFYYELILWTSGQILTEPLYTFTLAAALYALVVATTAENRLTGKFIFAGALFGLATLVRPTVFAPAIAIGGLLFAGAFFNRQKQFKHSLLFIATFLLVLLPWGLRNYLALNSFIILSNVGGHVLWLANNAEYDRYEHPDFAQFGGYTPVFTPPAELQAQLDGKTETEQTEIFRRTAFEHIYNYPKEFFIRAGHKFWNMWRPTFSISSGRNLFLSLTFYPLLLFSSLFGIFLVWKSTEPNSEFLRNKLSDPIFLLSAFLLVHLLVHSIVNAEIRFRVPLWTALIPFAALTFSKCFDLIIKVK